MLYPEKMTQHEGPLYIIMFLFYISVAGVPFI